MPTAAEVLAEAARRGLHVEQHPGTGQLMVAGLRADIWYQLRNEPHRVLVGTTLMKEYNE